VALAVLLAVAAPLVVLALAGSGDDEADERPAGLHVERSPGGLPEITIYLEDRSSTSARRRAAQRRSSSHASTPAAGSSGTAESAGLTDTDQGTLDPHAHVGMDPALLDRIARCRITGTDPPLEGRLR
jgi:hypothetical protein